MARENNTIQPSQLKPTQLDPNLLVCRLPSLARLKSQNKKTASKDGLLCGCFFLLHSNFNHKKTRDVQCVCCTQEGAPTWT